MAVLGNGSGTGFPGVIDTANTYADVVSPDPDDNTRVDADLVNDILATALALQSNASLIAAAINGFRLTLESGVPVSSSDQTAKTTLYATPYTSDRIGLYNGTNWSLRQSNEFSLALGTLTSGKNYDVFCYDNSGVPTLELLAWTNDSTRATALAYQNGVLSKSGALTRRYMGTIRTTSTTTTEDSESKRFVWNVSNQVARRASKTDSTSHTYNSATWRQWNGAASHQVECVLGQAQSVRIEAQFQGDTNATSGLAPYFGIGVDTTVAAGDAQALFKITATTTVDINFGVSAASSLLAVGSHVLSVNERILGTGTANFSFYFLTVTITG